MRKPKEELSDTLKEAIRRTHYDMATKDMSGPLVQDRETKEIRFNATAAEFNALMELLNTSIAMNLKQEKTARTSFRSESSVKNDKRANMYRDKAHLLNTVKGEIYSENYDKF